MSTAESSMPPHEAKPGATSGAFTVSEAKQARRLVTVLAVIGCFFVFELAGAIAAHSVVLQADAVHLLMDVFALAMSVVAMRLAVRRPTARFTFGMRRAEPVAAIFNAVLVLSATAQIVHEAVGALRTGGSPRADLMLIVATAALLVNGLSAWLLHDALQHDHGHAHDPDNPEDVDDGDEKHEVDHGGHGHDHDHHHDHGPKKGRPEHAGHSLNVRGAWLHLLGDTLGSFTALVAAIVIRYGGPAALDPLASFLVAAILILGAVRLVRDATLVLLESAPRHLPVDEVRRVILGVPGVVDVHDMHVWALGAGHDAITAHVRTRVADPTLTTRLSQKLRHEFHVEYVTVQVDLVDAQCGAPFHR